MAETTGAFLWLEKWISRDFAPRQEINESSWFINSQLKEEAMIIHYKLNSPENSIFFY
jgi:hypothetical protein